MPRDDARWKTLSGFVTDLRKNRSPFDFKDPSLRCFTAPPPQAGESLLFLRLKVQNAKYVPSAQYPDRYSDPIQTTEHGAA